MKIIFGLKNIFFFACLILSVNAKGQVRESKEDFSLNVDTVRHNFKKPYFIEIDEKDMVKFLRKEPSFGIYHDNYFITGIPTNKEVNKNTADAKFQISIRQRLFKTVMPYNTHLMLTYTQKSFWDVYASSAPFADNNYNPGLVLGKPLIHKNKLKGMFSIAAEHESNGQDTTQSRSWNYFTLTGAYFFNMNFSVQAKLWAGWLGDENKDLFKYRGYGLAAINYRTFNDKLWVSAVINPREKFGNFNTQLEINFKISKNANQYLFLQWYNGYGESLLEYNQYTSMVRIGICMKPLIRNIY